MCLSQAHRRYRQVTEILAESALVQPAVGIRILIFASLRETTPELRISLILS